MFRYLLALIVLALQAGCESQSSQELAALHVTPLRLSFWSAPTEASVRSIITCAVERFEHDNPSVRIELVFTPDEEYKTKIALEMATNDPPDIFMTWPAGFLKPFVNAGKVADLSPYLDADPAWRDGFQPHILDNLTFDGKVHAIPLSQSLVCLFYNERIFRDADLKPPATLAELERAVKIFHARGVIPIAMGNEFPWVGGMLGGLLINRIAGHEPYAALAQERGSWQAPGFIEAGRYLQKLVSMNSFPPKLNQTSYEDAFHLFSRGRAAMYLMGSWIVPRLVHENSPIRDHVGVVSFPAMEGGAGSPDDWMGQSDYNVGISAKCGNKEAAVRFLKLLSSREYQIRLAQELGVQPALQIDQTQLRISPLTRKLMAISHKAKRLFLFYDVRLGPLMGTNYNKTIRDILGGTSPEDAFAALQKTSDTHSALGP